MNLEESLLIRNSSFTNGPHSRQIMTDETNKMGKSSRNFTIDYLINQDELFQKTINHHPNMLNHS